MRVVASPWLGHSLGLVLHLSPFRALTFFRIIGLWGIRGWLVFQTPLYFYLVKTLLKTSSQISYVWFSRSNNKINNNKNVEADAAFVCHVPWFLCQDGLSYHRFTTNKNYRSLYWTPFHYLLSPEVLYETQIIVAFMCHVLLTDPVSVYPDL